MTPFTVENEILRLAILPELGGKVTSFFVKPVERELLFQPKQPYRLPRYGDSFAQYDTSGWDEMLPTIDPCQWKNIVLPDHGEIWSLPWEISLFRQSITGRVACKALPLLFERTITLEGSSCRVSYHINNNSDDNLPYLWAWHALWDLTDLTIHLPPEAHTVIPVHDNTFLGKKDTPLSWPGFPPYDLRFPSQWKKKTTTKIYLHPNIHIGEAVLEWPNVRLLVQWDNSLLPYFGIWYNHGGFKNEYNIAIEPTTGYYDRLDLAAAHQKVSILSPHASHSWELCLSILL